MIHARIDSVNEIPFNELKSNYITASMTLLPIGINRSFQSILASPTGYSNEVISFPISDPHLFTLKIALQSKRENVFDFCEVILPLRYFRVNRYYKFRTQTDSEILENPPSIDLSIQISSSKYKPFECHRSHVSFENDNSQTEDKEVLSKNELIARYWFSIVPEDQWSLIFRPGFLDLLKEEIDHFGDSEVQPPRQHEKMSKRPRRGEHQIVSLEHNPLTPPAPNNEPIPKFKPPPSMIETRYI
ncbi:hypothetical protein TRFO_32716 [Tritrichomonas foetus]|uniref:Uncharacterized protein n=1 Tax=Tritrichomonas foetus TaxID=1144522 RepID=A0A1J4JQB0_9EUKA|nr:hypothetical protein TRFO_32716 [Tritrichomonas foetus]|eukprot:OHT00600.1 hypothetical protein TRFO_32716 [Tritrichomonas foetus]